MFKLFKHRHLYLIFFYFSMCYQVKRILSWRFCWTLQKGSTYREKKLGRIHPGEETASWRDYAHVCRHGSAAGVCVSASKSSIRRFVITDKAPTRAFSWLKAATTAFTFKTLLRHYAKRALTLRSLNVKLGPRRNYHEGRAAIRHYANQTARPLWPLRRGPTISHWETVGWTPV